MFEFHGWSTIRVYASDSESLEIIHAREEHAISRVRARIRETQDEFSQFGLQRTSNALIVLQTHGLRNHRYEPVLELFQWVATEFPLSYGLLYVHDDEDVRRGFDYSNEFRVWRMARGELIEFDDPFLSSYIPTVEPPDT